MWQQKVEVTFTWPSQCTVVRQSNEDDQGSADHVGSSDHVKRSENSGVDELLVLW